MTEEEKKAIEILKELDVIDFFNEYSEYADFKEQRLYVDSIEIVLNLIQKQKEKIIEVNKKRCSQSNLRRLNERKMRKYRTENKKLKAELEKKDKIIYLMARAWKQDDERSVEEIIQYFKQKAEEN